MTTQQYCLRWNNHQPNFISVFSNLLNSESLVDVTLAAEGKHLQAHKVVLSACSSYFQSLFTVNPCQHPIVILKDVKFAHLKIIVNFMYYGEVNVSQEQLPCILKTAEMLKIKGLAEIPVDQSHKSYNNASERVDLLTPQDSNWSSGLPCQLVSPTPCALSPTSKRKRLRKSSTGSGSGSAEKNSDDCIPSELLLTAASATIIKSDPSSCNTENSNSLQTHSSESEMLLSGSHDNTDCTSPRQINLHIAQPQELNISDHKVSSPVEVCGTATASSHEALTGTQWEVMDQTGYANFTPGSSSSTSNMPTTCVPNSCSSVNSSPPNNRYHNELCTSPPHMIQKRRRSINPQADENFIKALEAVRFGGIGFCKAARMYGVNNRTLWLEYKKRGYPNFRLSIKNRKQENIQTSAETNQCTISPRQENSEKQICEPVVCSDRPLSLISSNLYEGKSLDLCHNFQRQKYIETDMNSTHTVHYQGIHFEQM